MKRGLEATGATFLTAAALFAASPEAQATDYQNPNQNPANRLAKQYVKEIGGRILDLARRFKGDSGISATSTSGAVTMEVNIDTGQSTVAGSNGEYTFTAFSDGIGNNGLGRNDINFVGVKSGKSPNDRRPLFALNMSTPHPHSAAPPEGVPGIWYNASGTSILPSGERVVFDGTADPNRHEAPPALWLDKSEVENAGRLMNKVIDEALNDQPTQPQEPPFGPLKRLP